MAKITITDNNGKSAGNFQSNNDESIAMQAQDVGIAVPVSCGVGACRTCVGKCTKGSEFIDKEAVCPPQITLEDDEFLTCICAVKPETPAEAEIEFSCENL